MLSVYKKLSTAAASIDGTLSLPYDLRKKGRLKAVTDAGEDIGLFLERGQVLQQGDLLETECGKVIVVAAADEPVVTAHSDDWLRFSKVCYHLGNRHLPLQIGECWLRFQPDHVLEELVALYGLTAEHEQAAFNPESGAYGAHGGHHHHGEEHHHDGHHHGEHSHANE